MATLKNKIVIKPPTKIEPDPHPPHSGNKYHRTIRGLRSVHGSGLMAVVVDIYCVLTAYPTGHPGLDHAAKKILCAGIRGKGSRVQDLKEARDALTRAIEDAEAETT